MIHNDHVFIYSFIFCAFLLLLTRCAPDVKQSSDSIHEEFSFTPIESSVSGLDFMNDIQESPSRNINTFDYMYNGGGVALGDFNNDGLADIFFTGNDVSNKLYLNKGELRFEDITASANLISDKWSMGVTLVDINSDGYLDIYVCNSGPTDVPNKLQNELYINNGDLTFSESAKAYGLDSRQRSIHSTFFDVDNDGDLDMWLSNHGKRRMANSPYAWLKKYQDELSLEKKVEIQNALYINTSGKFKNEAASRGCNSIAFGLGHQIADFNDDNYPDVFCTNDYFLPDYLYKNQSNGTFQEVGKRHIKHSSFFSMGCDAADYDNDGILDIALVDMTPDDHFRSKTLMESMNVKKFRILKDTFNFLPQYMYNSLLKGIRYGDFIEISNQLGVAKTDWSWAPLLADFDNDGFKDYLVTNGFFRDTKNQDYQKLVNEKSNEIGKANFTQEDYFQLLQQADSNPTFNVIFKNKNGQKFEKLEGVFDKPTFSNGAAYGDLDNDGDLDVVINNLKSKATLLRNNSSSNYLRLSIYDSQDFNATAGAKVYVYHNDQVQRVDNNFSRGYLSFMEPVIHFGLGTNTKIDSIKIEWNDGTYSSIKDVKLNDLMRIDRKVLERIEQSSEEVICPLMDLTNKINIEVKHKENYFDDFNKEILLPHKYSTLGPCIAVGDIDGDGLDDFYLGGSVGTPGSMMIQRGGTFVSSNLALLNQEKRFEDLGALFFDSDGDGDLDLYVASGGGGDIENKKKLTQDRLYINNGRGSYTLAQSHVLPEIISSTSALASVDIDSDGDLDLFVGARNNPGKYPLPSPSYLLLNEGGQFTDVIDQFFAKDEFPGMITDAAFHDINGDGDKELVVCGEWSAPSIFTKRGSKLTKVNIPVLDELKGWWQRLLVDDFDNDGDLDIVFGNMGLNNKFKPSLDKPLGVVANDFDFNGTHDIVLTTTYKDMIVPVRGKECSTEQMPFLENKFSKYSDFASSSLSEILPIKTLDKAYDVNVTTFASILVQNNGAFDFDIKELPFAAQSAPARGLVSDDFNQDGKLDVFIVGNEFNTEPETPSYDAGNGIIMFGNGDCTFKADHDILSTGVYCNKNTRAAASIKLGTNRKGVLVANNDDNLQLLLVQK